jgi:hypothetical protein
MGARRKRSSAAAGNFGASRDDIVDAVADRVLFASPAPAEQGAPRLLASRALRAFWIDARGSDGYT